MRRAATATYGVGEYSDSLDGGGWRGRGAASPPAGPHRRAPKPDGAGSLGSTRLASPSKKFSLLGILRGQGAATGDPGREAAGEVPSASTQYPGKHPVGSLPGLGKGGDSGGGGSGGGDEGAGEGGEGSGAEYPELLLHHFKREADPLGVV